MPLTPLGRQLRSVIAGIRITARNDNLRTGPRPAWISRNSTRKAPTKDEVAQRRQFTHDCSRHASAAVGFAPIGEEFDALESVNEQEEVVKPKRYAVRKKRSPRLVREQGNDVLGKALQDTGQWQLAPLKVPGKVDLSNGRNGRGNARPRSAPLQRSSRSSLRSNARFRIKAKALRPRSRPVSLESIMARYIRHQSVDDTMDTVLNKPFEIQPPERALLAQVGYDVHDIQAWAQIVSTTDSHEAATALAEWVKTHGHQALPFFVFSYLLRRPYLSARALRVLLGQAEAIVESRRISRPLTRQAVFVVFVRLARHARKVWPVAFDRIAHFLMDGLANAPASKAGNGLSHIHNLTAMLNKAMRLIVMPTAIETIKNNAYQEAAVVRILQFMSCHEPALHISREGYRAVILLQLAQRKSEKERQWAELKTLSWPPWKDERTAMDAYITADDHGLSKAGATLQRMREAGYAPHGWEKTAAIFAGWDTDQTPTVQTLVTLGTGRRRFVTGAATWAARITTTRTAQEAWAAYLAYEETKMPADPEVHLAVLRKLRKDSRPEPANKPRTRASDVNDQLALGDEQWPLFPGDVQETSPLPFSTHHHTYTRTPPPTVDGFYQYLKSRDIHPKGHCLAFLIANASTLRRGLRYIQESKYAESVIRPLLYLDKDHDIADVPLPIFKAFMELLSRFSVVPLPADNSMIRDAQWRQQNSTKALREQDTNFRHALFHATELLHWRSPLHLPSWNTVLKALSHESSLSGLRAVDQAADGSVAEQFTPDQDRWFGAIKADKYARGVVNGLQENGLALDVDGFMALCHVTENSALASWEMMREERGRETGGWRPTPYLREVLGWMRGSVRAVRLEREFRTLVGADEAVEQISLVRSEGMLLEVPSFTLLHIYVRALGWMAEHERVLECVKWMVEHESALAKRQKQDRNGFVAMRRTLCAVRVFLERSWLPRVAAEDVSDGGDGEGAEGEGVEKRLRLTKFLRRLESPAEQDVVDAARRLVESVETWSGWPGDEEIEEYCRDKRFHRVV